MEAGKLALEEIEFNLAETVENTLYLFATQAGAKGLELICDIEEGTPAFVIGDATRLRQIMTNFVANAIKFTERGEVVAHVLPLHQDGDIAWLRFEVRDTGIGIPEEARDNLFQPFVQADRSTTRRFGGTGLGLAICKQLSVAMGGSVGVESVLGEGSTFWFVLPFRQPADGHAADQQPLPPNLSNARALVLDDHPRAREILGRRLRALGLDVTMVETPDQALSKLREPGSAAIKLLFLDWQMPQIDGFTFAQKLCEEGFLENRRTILLTPLQAPFTNDQLSAAGIHVSLSKPLRQGPLLEALTDLEPAGSTALEPTTTSKIDGPARPALSILVAEDNVVNQLVVLGQLEFLGYHADIAADGEQAVAAFARHHYDLVFLDCHMPQIDGYEAARQIRGLEQVLRRPTRTYIVALTADAMEGDREAVLEAGMDCYLTKPVEDEQLEKVFERWHQPLPGAETSVDRAGEDSPVDFRRLRSITMGSPERMKKIAELYISQSKEFRQELQQAIERADLQEIIQLAHKWAGSSLTCGMDRLGTLLRELETGGRRNDDPNNLSTLFGTVAHEHDRAVTTLKSFLADK
jgi:CheY-like chemotaxis protein